MRGYAFWFESVVENGWKHVMYEGNKINFVTQYNYLGTIIVNRLNLNEKLNHLITTVRTSYIISHSRCNNQNLLVYDSSNYDIQFYYCTASSET